MSNEMLRAVPNLMEGVLLQAVDSSTPGEMEAVVVLPNKNQIKVVNEVGAFVLSLIDGKRTVAEIVDEVQRTYSAPAEQIQNDVLTYIQQLVSKEIVSFSTDQ